MHVLSVVFTVLRFDVEMGLVNGSIGTVVDFRMHEATHEISAVIIKIPNIDSPITRQREAYSFEVLKSIYFTRKQFPLMLAFAITVSVATLERLKYARTGRKYVRLC
jgi:hypothetical protein